MAHTPKYTTPSRSHNAHANIPVMTDPAASTDARVSPRVEALRKLVASGRYQVSPRHLAHQIMRSAGIKPV